MNTFLKSWRMVRMQKSRFKKGKVERSFYFFTPKSHQYLILQLGMWSTMSLHLISWVMFNLWLSFKSISPKPTPCIPVRGTVQRKWCSYLTDWWWCSLSLSQRWLWIFILICILTRKIYHQDLYLIQYT